MSKMYGLQIDESKELINDCLICQINFRDKFVIKMKI